MATPHGLSASTWRVLGLSVAAGYTSLGTMDICTPVLAATLLGIWPTRATTTPEAEDLITTATVLIGARDLSIGVALFALDYYRMPRSMGIVILSGMALCVIDTVWIWRARGSAWGLAFTVGASIWGWIGLNLLEL